MNEFEAILRAWPVLLAVLGVALALVIGFALLVDLGSKTRMELMNVYFIIVPLASMIGVIISGRDLTKLADSPLQTDINAVDTGSWLSRGVTLLCLSIAMERLVRYFIQKEYLNAHGKSLVWAMGFYVIGTSILPSLFGTAPGFNHQLFYALPIFIAVFSYAQSHSENIINSTRNIILIFLLASLTFLVINPNLVAETNYRAGLITQMTLRFYGFATHPNTLAPLCLVLICCVRIIPFKRRGLNYFSWAISGSALFLTQSKTSFFLIALVIFYFWIFDSKEKISAHGSHYYRQWFLKITTTITFAIASVLVMILYSSLAGSSLGDRVATIIDDNQFNTLTGRTQIWIATLNAVLDSPLFGYGPKLWGVEFRNNTGLHFAHAHNQYLQTLGAAGVVGLISLIAYLGTFGLFAWRSNRGTRGVSIGLFLFIVLRGITEVPLKIDNPFQTEFLTQMFLLGLCVGTFKYSTNKSNMVIRHPVANRAPSPSLL